MGAKVSDLIKLVRESSKMGVSRLEFGNFKVEFRDIKGAEDSGQNQVPAMPGQAAGLPENNEDFESSSVSRDRALRGQVDLFDDSVIRDMEVAQQLIDDPAGFESDQIREHLEGQRIAGEPDEEAQA